MPDLHRSTFHGTEAACCSQPISLQRDRRDFFGRSRSLRTATNGRQNASSPSGRAPSAPADSQVSSAAHIVDRLHVISSEAVVKRLLTVFSALALFGSWAMIAGAAVPQTMSYQGVLDDGAGNALTGTHSIAFSIYSAPGGGSALWTETQSVSLVLGGFNVILGSITPINLPFDQPYYVGMSVDGGAELTPRTPLASSPYSLSLRLPFFQAISNGNGPAFRADNSASDAVVGQSQL